MYTNSPDELKDRTTDFMHALAAADVDAVNISADRTGVGMMVHTWIPEDEVEAAEKVAADHGFELYGEMDSEVHDRYAGAAPEGRTRYRFETEA